MSNFKCPKCGYEASLEDVQKSGTILCRGKCKGTTSMIKQDGMMFLRFHDVRLGAEFKVIELRKTPRSFVKIPEMLLECNGQKFTINAVENNKVTTCFSADTEVKVVKNDAKLILEHGVDNLNFTLSTPPEHR